LFLNVGCGDDFRGDIRMDIKPDKWGLNLIADAQCIPIRGGVFDVVFCKSVLEHLVSPFKGLKEMKRVSRSYIIITVPNIHHWRRIARSLFTPEKDVNPFTKHFQAWDREAFKHLVNRVGDLIIESIRWGYFNGSMCWPSILFGSNMIIKMRVTS